MSLFDNLRIDTDAPTENQIKAERERSRRQEAKGWFLVFFGLGLCVAGYFVPPKEIQLAFPVGGFIIACAAFLLLVKKYARQKELLKDCDDADSLSRVVLWSEFAEIDKYRRNVAMLERPFIQAEFEMMEAAAKAAKKARDRKFAAAKAYSKDSLTFLGGDDNEQHAV